MGTALINRWPNTNVINPAVTIARVYFVNTSNLYYQITNHNLYYALGINNIVSFTQIPPIAILPDESAKNTFDDFVRAFYS